MKYSFRFLLIIFIQIFLLILQFGASSHSYAFDVLAGFDNPDVRFTQLKDLPENLKHYARLAKHTVNLNIPDRGSLLSETGVLISDSGYVLTAMHGFYGCLIENGIAQKLNFEGLKSTVYRNDMTKNKEAKCTLNLNHRQEKVPIVTVGPGFILKSSPHDTFGAIKSLNEGAISAAGDFIILKLPFPKDQNCARANSEKLEAHQMISSIGYPAETHRKNGHDTKGNTLTFSRGRIFSEARENDCVAQSIEKTSVDKQIAKEWLLNVPGAIWSSLDATHGSSGSPIFNEKTELSGLVARIFNAGINDAKQFCPATQIVPLSTIKIILENRTHPVSFEEIFNCH